MEKIITKEQNIKKAKRLQFAMKIFIKIYKIFNLAKNVDRKELYIKTDFGETHVLCYGFGNNEIKPVYFDIHGGGFVVGSAYLDDSMNIEVMKKADCKIVSIDYVKAPDFPFPAAVNEVYSTVAHFYKNAEKYRIKKEKMAIGGHSAGGNLSAVACMKAKQLGEFQFICQVLDYPVLDCATNPYEKPYFKKPISPAIMKMFNDCYIDDKEAYNPFASPIYAKDADLQNLPSALIILAGLDPLNNEGKQYAQKLMNAKVSVKTIEYENEPHGFTYKKSHNRNDAVNKIGEYLYENFNI